MAGDYDISGAFEAIENELLESMMRNMRRHKLEEITEGRQWSMWQAEQLKALARYRRENSKRYGKRFAEINSRIADMIAAAKEEGGMAQELVILNAIKKGFQAQNAFRGGTAEFFRLNERKLEALIKATQADMQKAEYAILRMADDQYRKAIFNAQVYANTGAGTYEKAVDMATKDMLSSGLNCVEYKNGARHSLADYADMAIRTASKRAYLQGEGEMRQAWGIPTVILNKRGCPCPKCLPFCGKIMIDDVWSGGDKDGRSPVTGLKYPLMSKAIDAGLYHPRCKDSHTTYFEGISTPPDGTYTKDELDRLAEDYRREQREQYARRQEKKFGRLARYSLDPENRERYVRKEREWKTIARTSADAAAQNIEVVQEEAAKQVAKNASSDIIKPKKKDLSRYLGQKIVETDDQSVREWYYANVSDIPNQVDKTKSFDEQVKQAFELRNKYKHEARIAMSDVKKAQELEKHRPAPKFEELVESKMKRKNMTREEALQDILETASKTNPDVNKEFGL